MAKITMNKSECVSLDRYLLVLLVLLHSTLLKTLKTLSAIARLAKFLSNLLKILLKFSTDVLVQILLTNTKQDWTQTHSNACNAHSEQPVIQITLPGAYAQLVKTTATLDKDASVMVQTSSSLKQQVHSLVLNAQQELL